MWEKLFSPSATLQTSVPTYENLVTNLLCISVKTGILFAARCIQSPLSTPVNLCHQEQLWGALILTPALVMLVLTLLLGSLVNFLSLSKKQFSRLFTLGLYKITTVRMPATSYTWYVSSIGLWDNSYCFYDFISIYDFLKSCSFASVYIWRQVHSVLDHIFHVYVQIFKSSSN